MRDTLEKINRALQCACERNDTVIAALSGLATEATLQAIETGQDDLITLLEKANWTSVSGNSIEYAYYSGVAAGNPSGNTSNVETATYKTGVSTIFTQTFAYNAADLVISITTT
jgi:hypothetical protein